MFGVFLWELYTNAARPYAHLSDEQLVRLAEVDELMVRLIRCN